MKQDTIKNIIVLFDKLDLECRNDMDRMYDSQYQKKEFSRTLHDNLYSIGFMRERIAVFLKDICAFKKRMENLESKIAADGDKP